MDQLPHHRSPTEVTCTHCGATFEPTRNPHGPPELPTQHGEPDNQGKKPWYFRTSVIVIMLLSIGPLALPLIWFHPELSPARKIIFTLIVAIATYALWLLTAFAYEYLMQTMKELETLLY